MPDDGGMIVKPSEAKLRVLGVRLKTRTHESFARAARTEVYANTRPPKPLSPSELGGALVEVYLTSEVVRKILRKHLQSKV